jgi:hypothetical protein
MPDENPAIQSQPAPTGEGSEITQMVIDDLAARREVGIQRYGRPLRMFNGRNALIDAYQEALDLTVYLRQRLAEDEAKAASDPEPINVDASFSATWKQHKQSMFPTFGMNAARTFFEAGLNCGRAEGAKP